MQIATTLSGIVSSEGGIVFGGYLLGKDSDGRTMSALNELMGGATLMVDRATTESYFSVRLTAKVRHLAAVAARAVPPASPTLAGLEELFPPTVKSPSATASRRHSSAMLHSPHRPSRTMRIFSSA